MTRVEALSDRIIGFLEGLTLAGGDHDGSPFKVLPWEKAFIRGAFGDGVDVSALSIARGNGKSCLLAGVAASGVSPSGPLNGNRREIVVVASSFQQSRIIFEDVLSFLRVDHKLDNRKTWRLQDSVSMAQIEYKPTGARVRCIGSDPAKAHGLRPAISLLDEPAQYDRCKADAMWSALRTGMGKLPGSRSILLGTRPAADHHFFSKLLCGGADYAQTHAASEDDDVFDVETWRKANPSLKHLPSLRKAIRSEASDAALDPSLLCGFEALRLNKGTSDVLQSTLLDASTWKRCEREVERAGRPYWGVDLGTNAAMSAIACYFPSSGRLDCMAAFPKEPDLSSRGLRDGVGRLYLECYQRKELIFAGQHAVDIGELLKEALQRFGPPAGIAADRWREAEAKDTICESVGPRQIACRFGSSLKRAEKLDRTLSAVEARSNIISVRIPHIKLVAHEVRRRCRLVIIGDKPDGIVDAVEPVRSPGKRQHEDVLHGTTETIPKIAEEKVELIGVEPPDFVGDPYPKIR